MFPFTDEELKKPVEICIQKVRPTLTLDGGDITLLGIKNSKVYVRLEGACKSCSASTNTLKYGVEKCLKEDIHPDIKLINVLYGQEEQFGF
ncbi:NifU family protein [Helicobacter sp. 13S00477-4]|uniref:NifU family protein n=1 Tax=Helicobacter sp. 13S00477-4 TaxID=1905759 RepID=UPI000BA77CDB|nr:NifU family protein [Helicobacter sp. 13S00477-4]PAF51653.1 hypothetical protein BKH44_05420 [Helicobacter sp. 13S00477-4]